MAYRTRQSIRRVVGFWVVVEMEKIANHIGNLLLIRRAGADDSLLNLHGRVFADLDTCLLYTSDAADEL